MFTSVLGGAAEEAGMAGEADFKYMDGEKGKPIKVYNLLVEDYHTYYVSGHGVLVHNTECSRGNVNILKNVGENGNVSKEIRESFNSIKESPNYPKGFEGKKNGTTSNKVNNQQLLEMLREIESGTWKKVYKDGYNVYGKKISIHYFQSQSGKYLMLK